jgi:hypothetical protein
MESTNSSLNIINSFFEAGPIEVGLEVGADSGLSTREYIQVPKQCHKKISYQLSNENLQSILEDTDALCDLKCNILHRYQDPVQADPDDVEVEEWLAFDSAKQRLVYYIGRIWVMEVDEDGFAEDLANDSNPVKNLSSEQWTSEDYKAFICANLEASEDVTQNNKGFFHSCTFIFTFWGRIN